MSGNRKQCQIGLRPSRESPATYSHRETACLTSVSESAKRIELPSLRHLGRRKEDTLVKDPAGCRHLFRQHKADPSHEKPKNRGRLEWIGYLPRAMANKLPLISSGIRAKLETARVARLATLDAERRPHAPICFAFDGSVFYSAIDRKPKRVAPSRLARLKNIKETPQVALLVDQYDEDWTRLWYVLVRGEAELVSASAEHKRAIQRLRAKYPQYDADMIADDAPVLRITPVRITAWGKI
jgi:PPOX class probable F420-dependent enzyme